MASGKDDLKSIIEHLVLNSKKPTNSNEPTFINYNGMKFEWVNKDECDNWEGPIALEDYPINYDEFELLLFFENVNFCINSIFIKINIKIHSLINNSQKVFANI